MILAIALVAGAAVLINLPCGVWRSHCTRLSWQWFAALHISIPLVILIRMAAGLSWTAAPSTLAGAAFGQVIGGRVGQSLLTRRMPLWRQRGPGSEGRAGTRATGAKVATLS